MARTERDGDRGGALLVGEEVGDAMAGDAGGDGAVVVGVVAGAGYLAVVGGQFDALG
ncbi:hypothetical protein [Streptomyces albus]|uniref:hypothetical protein n=1 Tax=Streptomyces albus TaxID=1888 RepID=UPI0033FEDAFF